MSIGLLALLGLLALTAGAVSLVDQRLRDGGRQRHYKSARWATKRDLRPLRVKGPEKGRVILGRHGRHLIAAEPQRSVIVFGPTRIARKTTGIAIPALKEWQGPAIATSVKPDLLLETKAAREGIGEVMVFDPSGATAHGNTRIGLLLNCQSWDGALQSAGRLCSSARTRSGLEDTGFWHTAAERLIAPLLFAAANDDRSMADVMHWLSNPEEAKKKVKPIVAKTKCAAAIDAWAAHCSREERHRSSITTTAETVLSPFSDSRVIAATSEPNYGIEKLLNGKSNTLYLFSPRSEQERLGVLFATVIEEAIAAVDTRFAETGKPLDPPLLLLLDEAANLAPIAELDEIAATVAGEGIQLLTIFQDLAQVRTVYGGRAQSIVNNHVAKVFGAGSGDPDIFDYVKRVTGSVEIAQRSETRGKGRDSTSERGAFLDLAPAQAVRQQAPGEALLVYGHLAPARVGLGTYCAGKRPYRQ
jgi:type IV secretion system protein VirD4